MGSRKGKPNRLTAAVKDRIEAAFNTVNGPANAGLIKLAEEHPAIFYGMVAKLIPAQMDLHVGLVALDLGLAMEENQRNLARLSCTTIDLDPDTPRKAIVEAKPDLP